MGQFVQGQQQAWQQYDRLVADHRILFLAEPSTAEAEFRKLTQSSHPRHSMWSDAYLAALAIVNSAAVSTFDRDFQKFPGLNVELIALSP